jgi:hypothetical protein
MITNRDEGTDYLPKPGFRLVLSFAKNDFFTNKVQILCHRDTHARRHEGSNPSQ